MSFIIDLIHIYYRNNFWLGKHNVRYIFYDTLLLFCILIIYKDILIMSI